MPQRKILCGIKDGTAGGPFFASRSLCRICLRCKEREVFLFLRIQLNIERKGKLCLQILRMKVR